MTMLLDGRLRDLATQTHTLEEKVSSLGWMAGSDSQTLKSMTRAQAHLMLAGFVCWTATQTPVQPEQTIIQQVETTGDVKRLCIEAKTDGRIDAMSCQLIDPHTGGVK